MTQGQRDFEREIAEIACGVLLLSELYCDAPPTFSIKLRTALIPIPRPEISETAVAVDVPGAKMVWATSRSELELLSMPLCKPLSRSLPSANPRPSSRIVTLTAVSPACAAMDRRPLCGLPAVNLSAGISIPWSSELRRMWIMQLSMAILCSGPIETGSIWKSNIGSALPISRAILIACSLYPSKMPGRRFRALPGKRGSRLRNRRRQYRRSSFGIPLSGVSG